MTTPPRRTALAAALAALALAAAVPLAGAQDADDQRRPCHPIRDEPAFAGDAQVQSWSGDVDENGTGGTLDIQSYHAGSYVVPWNRSAWRVEVGEVDPNDALQVTVDASTDGGFSLAVSVEPRGGVGGLGLSASNARAQVKAWVPQRVYDQATLTPEPNGTGSMTIGTSPSFDDEWDALVLGNLTADAARIEGGFVGAQAVDARLGQLDVDVGSQQACLSGIDAGEANVTASSGEIGLLDVEVDRIETTVSSGELALHGAVVDTLQARQGSGDARIRNLTAETAVLRSASGGLVLNRTGVGTLDVGLDTGDAHLGRVTARTATLTSGSGEIHVRRSRITDLGVTSDSGDTSIRSLTADSLAFEATSGDLDAQAIEARDLAVTLESGDLDAEIRPTGVGLWNISAQSGEVALHVPANETYGYDAVLRTQSGEPRIEIPGTEVVSRSEHRLHVRTTGYQDRPVRTRMRIVTDSGDVTADSELESDQAAFGSGGRTYGVIPSTPEQAAVDAGILAVLAAVATVAWPKVRTFVAPLYSRIARSEVLHHPVRQEIHDVIQEEPGLHFRALQRRLDAGRGVLEHHLDKLVDADVLSEHEARGYTCYFVQGSVAPEIVEVAPLVRADTARALLVAADAEPGASVNALAEAADVSNSTASYHLDKLEDAGLVAKERGSNGLEVAPTDLGARALEALSLDAELAVSENRA